MTPEQLMMLMMFTTIFWIVLLGLILEWKVGLLAPK